MSGYENGGNGWSNFSKAFTAVASTIIGAAIIGGAALLFSVNDKVTSLVEKVGTNTKAIDTLNHTMETVNRRLDHDGRR